MKNIIVTVIVTVAVLLGGFLSYNYYNQCHAKAVAKNAAETKARVKGEKPAAPAPAIVTLPVINSCSDLKGDLAKYVPQCDSACKERTDKKDNCPNEFLSQVIGLECVGAVDKVVCANVIIIRDRIGATKKNETVIGNTRITNQKLGRIGKKIDQIAGKAGVIPTPKGPAAAPSIPIPTGPAASQNSGANCQVKINQIRESKAVKCEKVEKLVALGRSCFNADEIAKIGHESNKCEVKDDRGIRKITNPVSRFWRKISGSDDFNRATGKDLNNGWEQNEGGDWMGAIFAGTRYYIATGAVTKVAAKNLPGDAGKVFTRICDNLFDKCDYDAAYGGHGGSSGGQIIPPGNLVGPGNPGETSNAGTIGNNGTDINTPISNMTPVPGIGGPGQYGTAPPIAEDSTFDGSGTYGSNVDSILGYSTGGGGGSSTINDILQ